MIIAVAIFCLSVGAGLGIILAGACSSGASDDAFRAGYRAGRIEDHEEADA